MSNQSEINLKALDTEQINENTKNIDRIPTLDMVKRINSEDKQVALAVEKVLPEIAAAIDGIYARMKNGGRLVYCGAGTSGRLGVLDASECPPTYGVSDELVVPLMAGGLGALIKAVEGAEDSAEEGVRALTEIQFTAADTLVGLAASGRTPYVIGAMKQAKALGGLVIGLACTRNAELAEQADIMIAPVTGPEVVTGSTRMKAGTAQKMVLNMLSTGVMIKLGKTYGNLMVDVKATNAKLVKRAKQIVCMATDATEEVAEETLSLCGYSAKHAILMLLTACDYATAKNLLEQKGGRIVDALTPAP